MKVVSTKLTNPEWEALVDKCNEKGMTIAEYLRELLKKDSDGTLSHAGASSKQEKPVESILDRIRRNRRATAPPHLNGAVYLTPGLLTSYATI